MTRDKHTINRENFPIMTDREVKRNPSKGYVFGNPNADMVGLIAEQIAITYPIYENEIKFAKINDGLAIYVEKVTDPEQIRLRAFSIGFAQGYQMNKGGK